VAGVFGCAEDCDGVGGLSVVHAGDGGDLAIDPSTPDSGNDQGNHEQAKDDPTAGGTPASQIGFRDDHLPINLD
jgi:hypothetical protein